MIHSISFRTRLMTCFLAVIMAAMLLPAFYARHIIRQDILTDAQAGSQRELRLAEQLLHQKAHFTDETDLQNWMAALGKQLDARITYITLGGRVVADSDLTQEQVLTLDNHAHRPEIIQAENETFGISTRYSATLDRDLIYAAKRVENVSGVPEGLLRLAVPFSGVQHRLERMNGNFLLVLGLVMTMAVFLSVILTRTLANSMAEMIGVAKAIGQGEYAQRLRVYPGEEFQGLADSINQMAASIESHVAVITGQKRELEAILDGMNEGVMVLDGAGVISKTNHALTRIFTETDTFEGLRPLEVVRSPELQEACDKALSSSGAGPWTLQIEPRPERIYTVTIVHLDPTESGLGAILVFHDISELKRLEKVRRDFVANVSHELRTPLTTIKGYSETLAETPTAGPDGGRGFLEIIVKNADHMAKMVEDLLSLSRLEGGRERFTLSHVNPARALNEAFRTCAQLAQAKNVTLTTELPASGLAAYADHDRLVQIFRNLLENSIKYGPTDSEVVVDVTTTDNELIFGVADDGPGIPAKDKQRIFERFYRVEKHRAKNGGVSSGLGLAISKHIVERLGGRIWVDDRNTPDGGSIFRFSLPVAKKNTADSDHFA